MNQPLERYDELMNALRDAVNRLPSHPKVNQQAECAAAYAFHGKCAAAAKLIWPLDGQEFDPSFARHNVLRALGHLYCEMKASWPSSFYTPAKAIDLWMRERERQMSVEGWKPLHDDRHVGGELALAAAAYCMAHSQVMAQLIWPWDAKGYKPKESDANHVRAGALLLAEWERLERSRRHHG